MMVAEGTRIAPRPPAQVRTCGLPACGSCLRSNVIGFSARPEPTARVPAARPCPIKPAEPRISCPSRPVGEAGRRSGSGLASARRPFAATSRKCKANAALATALTGRPRPSGSN
jgi:hypothetical protein